MHATHPRGRIRPKDLDSIRVDLSDAFDLEEDESPAGLTLEFRVGHSVLGRIEVTTLHFREEVKIPAALRKQLQGVRGCIRWGRFDLDPKETVAGFWLEPPSVAEKQHLQDVDQALRAQPLWIRQVIRAQALLDAAYDSAAMEEAEAVLASHPGEPHALAIVGAVRRLHRMKGLEDHWKIMRALRKATDERQMAARPAGCDLDAPLPEGLKRRTPHPRAGCGDH